MNRNVESHFSSVPHANVPRSRFDRSQDVKFTLDVASLVPFYVDEILPGDTFDITTSKVIRLQTLLTPVMDNLYLDTYWFFVPLRLVWDHAKNFFGESERAWTPEVEYHIPQIRFSDQVEHSNKNTFVEVGDVLDYMGVPVGVTTPSVIPLDQGSLSVSALPYRCYQLIYSEFFRDENLIDPVNIYRGDATVDWFEQHRKPYKAAKFHDYFTSALPAPAKVNTPVSAPVKSSSSPTASYIDFPVRTRSYTHSISGYSLYGRNYVSAEVSTFGRIIPKTVSDTNVLGYTAGYTEPGNQGFEPSNLYAQVGQGDLGVLITDLRYAVAVQQFYERLGLGGSRYIELISSFFGVESPDQRLQRPEYLGGNRIPISIHQITNQSQGENAFLGDLGAMSLTTDKHPDFVKSFVEHGYLIGLCVARYDHSYPQGLERFWFRKNRFDFYWPQFANLSEQAIYKGEIYWNSAGETSGSTHHFFANDTFGYQERYAEYRYKPNKVMAEMRPGIANTLDSWHFADYYLDFPTLSSSWIQEDKTNVDRTLAVTSSVSNQLFCDIYIQNYSTRPMPLFGVPGLTRM